MIYLCIYNPETKATLYDTEEPNDSLLYYVREAARLQAIMQGPGWLPYCGDTPFAFPIDNAS